LTPIARSFRQLLLIILDRSRRRFRQLDLVVHGLDFVVQVFETRDEIFFLLRKSRREPLRGKDEVRIMKYEMKAKFATVRGRSAFSR
jgi:hypothetical protein